MSTAKQPTATDVGFTYACGLGVMAATAPVIHPLNVVAAAAAKTQSTSGKAWTAVYRGLGGNPPNNAFNYWNGLTGHLSKELVRSWGRIGGVIYIEPYFKSILPGFLAPHALATVMATYEVIFANPTDVWKSYRSTGQQTHMNDLFKGSIGNFCRQYGMWFVWSRSIPVINGFLTNTAGVDPNSTLGVGLRSVLQSAACTSVTYPVELWLRTVQVRANDYPVKSFSETARFAGRCLSDPSLIKKEGAYARVFADLYRANGIRGMGLGMTSKFIGNTILLSGANYLPKITEFVKSRVL